MSDETQENGKHSSILNSFLPQLKDFVKSETVFGKAYEVGDITLIPVNSVKVGFGFGNGELLKKRGASGGGGGVLLSPVAFIVIKDGNVTIESLSSGTIENVLDKVPGLLEKVSTIVKKNFGENEKDKTSPVDPTSTSTTTK
ncbi:MAG: putative spore protein YtfJ [bacterium]|jgi:uncharacterized spore protein YtfJ